MQTSIAAGAFALAELLCGIAAGRFFEIDRAVPDGFIAWRPALMLLLILALRRQARWGAIIGGLALALIGESLLLWRLGGGVDARGIAIQAGAALALAGGIDLAVRGGMRLPAVAGGAMVLAGLAALVTADPLLRAQQATEPTPRVLARLPRLAVVTGLPIVRGEGDIGAVLAGKARPAASWDWLAAHYRVAPIDYVTPAALAGRGLLLLAQPRAMQPAELAAIDAWVSAGGRALVLADPALHWDSIHPLGDPRAPPATTLLDPLLTHWGVRLDMGKGDADPRSLNVIATGQNWRVGMRDPGAFVALDDRCRNETFLWLMRCSIGQGRVLLVADADLMADRLWATPTRIADNGPLLGAWLDGLAGISRDRHADSIRWIDPAAPRGLALIPAFLPGLLALGIGAILHRRRR